MRCSKGAGAGDPVKWPSRPDSRDVTPDMIYVLRVSIGGNHGIVATRPNCFAGLCNGREERGKYANVNPIQLVGEMRGNSLG